jgi:hypothetical protein
MGSQVSQGEQKAGNIRMRKENPKNQNHAGSDCARAWGISAAC